MGGNNELSLADQFTQADIPKMLENVNAKILKLKGGPEKEASTIGKTLDPFGEIANINTVDELIKAYSSVGAREKLYKDAVKELKLKIKVPAFTIDGVAPAKWKDDIKIRIQEVAFKDQLASLEKIKSKLEENLSQEAKLANDLQEVNNIMKDMM